MRFLLFLIFFINLWANNLIITYPNLKKYYYKNQIVNLQIKILTPKNDEINFSLNKGELNITKQPYIYLLNIKFKNDLNNSLTLLSRDFNKTIKLNNLFQTKTIDKIPNFCNVIADKLKIYNPISTLTDNRILLSFTIKTVNGNLKDFKINNDENLTVINNDEATYYTYLPINTKKFTFYYFNTLDENYKKITVPIVLKEETISTQTDINPEEKTFFTPFNILILVIIAFFIIIFLIYQNILILIIPIILSAYLILTVLPKGEKILKKDSPVKILPTQNSTIFYRPIVDTKVKILNKTKNYTKIKIDGKIGWVKNENLE
ncbi:conserved hypothetical protein [Lebetimonas natsushimae]|uniref:SH3b domain-containing protein n=1 Tax=Lebetimonas natsushimae TaxID=1936991 RepID=A0A292YEM7_9BACT|nr:hypothetical protein [Lebetimonas natsushimae]GAX87988.1 conserved hypothetical protein [Lebetimonas natsushimae]